MFTVAPPDAARSLVERVGEATDSWGTPDVDLVAIDTETTGLAWHDRIVELGAVRFRGGRVVDRWRTLVNPERPIPARVVEIHGITDAHVEGAPLAAEALEEFRRFCEGAVLLAHNAAFDRDVLAAEWARANAPPPAEPMYCTWRFAKHCIEGAPRYGLAALAAHLELPAESPHRALADADLTRQLFLACCERLGAPCTLGTLDAHATDDSARPWSLRGAVRRVRDLPLRLRPLRGARSHAAPVTLTVNGPEGEAPALVRGVPTVFYQRGADGVVDLRAEGAVVSVAFSKIARVDLG